MYDPGNTLERTWLAAYALSRHGELKARIDRAWNDHLMMLRAEDFLPHLRPKFEEIEQRIHALPAVVTPHATPVDGTIVEDEHIAVARLIINLLVGIASAERE